MKATALHFLLLVVGGWINRRQLAVIEYLQEENRVLREQLGNRRLRFTDAQRRRLARKGKVLGRKALEKLGSIVAPDTILRWYRRLIAAKYDGSKARRNGAQRSKPVEVRELILRMARENPSWGYTRIVGALKNLGFAIGRTTVARVLAEHGIDPAPQRSKGMSWQDFLRAHWGAIAAADFLTAEVLTLWGLTRYHVLFLIDLKARIVHIAGIVHEPDGRWLMQIGRSLLDAYDGFLLGKTHLILDRDPVFTAQFCRLLQSSGVKIVQLPPSSPNLNAYAERFVGSIRRECLNKLILLGEWHLRQALAEFAERHYRLERNHQGLLSNLIETRSVANQNGDIRCRKRLDGLLKYYYREAA